jgi:ribosomal protein S18 acetylase RimI-like enzyme
MSDNDAKVGTVDTIDVRLHGPQDKPQLLELLEMAMVETYPDLKLLTRSEMRERVESEFAHYYGLAEKEIWVAAAGTRVAGCLWVMESFHPITGRPDFFVVNVAVRPEFRGKGVGRRLFDATVNEARKRGLPFIRLFVNPANEAAFNLYQRIGFVTQTHEMRLDLGSADNSSDSRG